MMSGTAKNPMVLRWLALCATAIMLMAGCGERVADDSSGEETPRRPLTDYSSVGGQGLNVILVSVDTTRADHLGCYGHPEIQTPNIDRFAAEGTRFAQATSAAPLTLPSHATMLTGSYPFVHGARDNGLFVVAQENVTLAELFAESGYATHAEVAAVVLGAKYGLDQGFDSYGEARLPERQMDVVAVPHPDGDPALEGALGEIEVETPVVELDRKADEITLHGIEFLNEQAHKDEPFFLFLHYFDPHWPHEAPEAFAAQYQEGYHAEIAYFDHEFGKLIQAVRDLGLTEDTLVILTSDHGEGRGQHGEYTHSNFLYDTTLHVPLILWAPGRVAAGRVVDTQVRLVDLAPTVADFARLEMTEQMQGTSLLPLLTDPGRELRLPAYADTLVPKHAFAYSPLRSLRTDGWKYIHAPRPELYNLSEDPGELFNLVKAEPDRAARMKSELRAIIAESPLPATGGAMASLDQEELRKLAALGYVSPTGFRSEEAGLHELDHFEPDGVNPKDRIEMVELWSTGLGTMRAGDWEGALRIFTRFMDLEPELVAGPRYVGRALMMLDRKDEAIEMLRRALELDPAGYYDLRSLGNLLVHEEDFAGAADAYREAIRHNPEEIVSRLNLGILLMLEQQYPEALALFGRALEEAPRDPVLHLERGIALRLAGRTTEASAALGEALTLNPRLVKAHAELAIARFQLGQTDAAIAGLEEAVSLMPDEAVLHHQLASMRTAVDDLDTAGESFARVATLIPDNPVAHQNLGLNLLVRGMPALRPWSACAGPWTWTRTCPMRVSTSAMRWPVPGRSGKRFRPTRSCSNHSPATCRRTPQRRRCCPGKAGKRMQSRCCGLGTNLPLGTLRY